MTSLLSQAQHLRAFWSCTPPYLSLAYWRYFSLVIKRVKHTSRACAQEGQTHLSRTWVGIVNGTFWWSHLHLLISYICDSWLYWTLILSICSLLDNLHLLCKSFHLVGTVTESSVGQLIGLLSCGIVENMPRPGESNDRMHLICYAAIS